MIFSDESVFKARDFHKRAWALPYENIWIHDRTGNQPCQAVSAAVCKCHKLLAVTQTDYSFDTSKYLDHLRDIRGACKDEKIYLFIDNASYHKASLA